MGGTKHIKGCHLPGCGDMLYCPLCAEILDGNLMSHMREVHKLENIIKHRVTNHLECICGFESDDKDWEQTWSDMYDHWRAQYELHSMLHLFTTMDNKVS